jgi:hypothetical protein
LPDRADVLPIDAESFVDGFVIDPGWFQDQEIEWNLLFYFVEDALDDVVIIFCPNQDF